MFMIQYHHRDLCQQRHHGVEGLSPIMHHGVEGLSLNAPATKNPLCSIRSYYSFAHTHMAVVANKATWNNVYKSYSEMISVVTVTYPGSQIQRRLKTINGTGTTASDYR